MVVTALAFENFKYSSTGEIVVNSKIGIYVKN